MTRPTRASVGAPYYVYGDVPNGTPTRIPEVPASGQIRCFCSRHPLLAVYGVANGKPFIHVKVWKQERLYCEMLVRGDADLALKCRDCYRWYRIFIINENKPKLVEIADPELENDGSSLVGLPSVTGLDLTESDPETGSV